MPSLRYHCLAMPADWGERQEDVLLRGDPQLGHVATLGMGRSPAIRLVIDVPFCTHVLHVYFASPLENNHFLPLLAWSNGIRSSSSTTATSPAIPIWTARCTARPHSIPERSACVNIRTALATEYQMTTIDIEGVTPPAPFGTALPVREASAKK